MRPHGTHDPRGPHGPHGTEHRRAGFTLIEVMITLLITTAIMLTVTAVLADTRRTRDEIHNITERQLAGPAILQRLERDLRALFVFNRESGLHLRIRDRVIDGMDADSIDFVCTVDGLLPVRDRVSEPFLRADVNEVGYRLRQRPDADDFLEIYRREGFGVDEEPFDGGRFALLHDRLKGFNIEVFEEDGPEAEPEDGFDGDEYYGLPARIVITMEVEMAPRLVRDQIVIERRTIPYQRVFRFPQMLRRSLSIQPIPYTPTFVPPVDPTAAAAAGGGLPDPQEDPGAGSGSGGSSGGGGSRGGRSGGAEGGGEPSQNPFGEPSSGSSPFGGG